MRIAAYEEPMAAQVAELFHRHYGVDRAAFSDRFVRFYEHPYQRDRSLRVVAIEDERVVGFAGFCLWPYGLGGRRFDSFQCCDVLLDESRRGRGEFQRMLDFAGEQHERRRIDFIVGFPVEAAKNAFLRNGWKNVLDLQWYVKLLDPFAFARELRVDAEPAAAAPAPPLLRLADDDDFRAWRRHYAHRERYVVRGPFELKAIRRRRVLRELIVGDVRADDADFASLAKSVRGATYLSIALNPLDPLVPRIAAAGFRKIRRRIAFIVKPFLCDDLVSDAARWRLFRADIDTW